MPKKMSDTTPLKGIPSKIPQNGFRPPRVSLPNRQNAKKEGGVKLLDINEQPLSLPLNKKRKRQQDMEDAKRAADEAQAAANVKSEQNANPTPDYAANLATSLNPGAVPPPAYVPPTPQAPTAPAPVYAPLQPATVPLATQQNSLPGATVTVALPTVPHPQVLAGTRLVQLPTQPLPQLRMAGLQTQVNMANNGLVSNITATRTVVQPQHIIMQQPRQTFIQAQPQQQILRQVQ